MSLDRSKLLPYRSGHRTQSVSLLQNADLKTHLPERLDGIGSDMYTCMYKLTSKTYIFMSVNSAVVSAKILSNIAECAFTLFSSSPMDRLPIRIAFLDLPGEEMFNVQQNSYSLKACL